MTASPFIGRPHDFDFLVGHWHVNNRRLRQRFAGCEDWDEFPARSEARAMLDGVVSIDEIRFPTRGFSGLTLRTLERETNRWAIYWINSVDGSVGNSHLFPPVRGGFDGARGEFYGDDSDDGRAVKVRFLWSRLGDHAARWEQAFSLDGDAWETNWVMQFARADAPSPKREAA